MPGVFSLLKNMEVFSGTEVDQILKYEWIDRDDGRKVSELFLQKSNGEQGDDLEKYFIGWMKEVLQAWTAVHKGETKGLHLGFIVTELGLDENARKKCLQRLQRLRNDADIGPHITAIVIRGTDRAATEALLPDAFKSGMMSFEEVSKNLEGI